MADESTMFVVDESGERTVVHFRDWETTRKDFFRPQEPAVLAAIRNQLRSLTAKHHSKVLAVDMATIDLVPSAFLGVLVSLHKFGIKIELLHPTEPVRQMLETTKLNRVFAIVE